MRHDEKTMLQAIPLVLVVAALAAVCLSQSTQATQPMWDDYAVAPVRIETFRPTEEAPPVIDAPSDGRTTYGPGCWHAGYGSMAYVQRCCGRPWLFPRFRAARCWIRARVRCGPVRRWLGFCG